MGSGGHVLFTDRPKSSDTVTDLTKLWTTETSTIMNPSPLSPTSEWDGATSYHYPTIAHITDSSGNTPKVSDFRCGDFIDLSGAFSETVYQYIWTVEGMGIDGAQHRIELNGMGAPGKIDLLSSPFKEVFEFEKFIPGTTRHFTITLTTLGDPLGHPSSDTFQFDLKPLVMDWNIEVLFKPNKHPDLAEYSYYYSTDLLFQETTLGQTWTSENWNIDQKTVSHDRKLEHVWSFHELGPHTIQYEVFNNRCTTEKTLQIVIVNNDVLIPSAFTPNGDGENDTFGPIATSDETSIDYYRFAIFNRFGQKVFYGEGHDPRKIRWDGKFNGVPAEMGTYYYSLSYDLLKTMSSQTGATGTSEPTLIKGDVTLIR